MAVMDIPKYERFFRAAAGLDIDKADLRRLNDLVNAGVRGLLFKAQGTANANVRQVVEPVDLPIAAGLEHCMFEFRKLDADIGIRESLRELIAVPPLDYPLSIETTERLPDVAGGIAFALARAIPILDPNAKNPQSIQWERALRLFALFL